MYDFSLVHHYYHELIGDRPHRWESQTGLTQAASRWLRDARRALLRILDMERIWLGLGPDSLWSSTRRIMMQAAAVAQELTATGAQVSSSGGENLFVALHHVLHGVELMSTLISSYEGMRNRFVLNEGLAAWMEGAKRDGLPLRPSIPLATR